MATAMAASAAERAVLEEEFRWLLHAEVHAVLRQLQDILKEASLRFTLPGPSTEGPAKQENFILGSCGTDQVKGVLTLQGDALSQADVNLKMPRNNQLLHFAFREDKQWKLQQIQDARNHVSQAIYLLANRDDSYQFKTGAEVLKLMDAVMLQLTRARNRLTTPATLTLPEIAASGLTVSTSHSPYPKKEVCTERSSQGRFLGCVLGLHPTPNMLTQFTIGGFQPSSQHIEIMGSPWHPSLWKSTWG